MILGCSALGTIPTDEDIVRLEQSPQYDKGLEQFDNPSPVVRQEMDELKMSIPDILKFFFAKGERTPDARMPEKIPAINSFNQSFGSAEAIWFGHSSLLLRMSEKNILIDPVFSNRASPVPFSVVRFQEPVLPLEDLPEIDFIVISHDHYDHLDMNTVKYFRDRQAQFIVPLGVGSHLRGWGIHDARITELDWWEKTRRGEIEFIATPAQHFSGRSLNDRNKTLWASWVIHDVEQTVYFSGDSGYGPHFKEIGEQYGPFDAAFIETGQYNNKWRSVHMMPEESAQAYFDLKAELFIPIHWAMFQLSMHTWYQPAMEITEQAKLHDINLITPKIGQVINFEETPSTHPWWQPWVDPSRPAEWYAQKVN